MAQIDHHTELDDLVYSYPEITTPRFQTLISAKKEFRELSSEITENVPQRGQFFKHQILVHRYMLIYDRLLLIHRTGTGKTCAAGGTSEMFKHAVMNATGDFINLYMKPQRTHIKHVYILVRGPALESEFKKELVCRCSSPDEYENTELVRNARTIKSRKANITRELGRYYTVTRYRKFTKSIMARKMSDDDIRREYSGSLFIFDEIHNLRIDPLNPDDSKEQSQHYNTLHRLFHAVERSKVMLLTATAMINEPSEIVPIMNLILPLNQQMPPADTYDYTKPDINVLEPYFRGRVSYVRELDTAAVPIYQGPIIEAEYEIGGKIYKSQQKIWPTVMSGPVNTDGGDTIMGQAAGYLNALSSQGKRDAFHERERQASNFVFPDGSYGNTPGAPKQLSVEGTQNILTMSSSEGMVKQPSGFNKYVIEDGPDKFRATPELLPWLQNLEYLRVLSSKYAEIVRLSIESKGNVYCFSNFITGSGAIVLSLCFEANGFSKFEESTSIFMVEQRDPGGLRPYCPPQRSTNIDDPSPPDRLMSIRKGVPRYALLTSMTSPTRFQTILETYNSPENRHGELIKVLIVSPVGREGINTANVVQIHLVGPDWNQASTYQAISRALRATSHVDLLREERHRISELGGNPDDATIPVDIYQHAAIFEDHSSPDSTDNLKERGNDNGNGKEEEDDEEEKKEVGPGIDLMMYQQSERKDIEIKRIERIMKQVSIDCQIHKNRNIRDTDRDGSPICDYDVCKYECFDPPPSHVDLTSYDVIYSGPLIEVAIDDIKSLFRSIFSITFDNLYRRLSQHRPKFIDMAIERIIDQKMKLTDRFGYRSYLREDLGTIFLQRDFPLIGVSNTQDKYSLSFYSSTLIGTSKQNLLEFVSSFQSDTQIKIMREINQLTSEQLDTDRLDKLLEELPMESHIVLLETAISETFVEHVQSKLYQKIIQKYLSVSFEFIKPIELIPSTEQALANRGKSRGRKAKADTIPNVHIDLSEQSPSLLSAIGSSPKLHGEERGERGGKDEENNLVYIHTMYGQIVDRVSYSVTAKFNRVTGKIRILDPSEGTGWRDASIPEQLVYSEIIQNTRRIRNAQFEQFDIYGLLLASDKQFRIVNKITEDTAIAKTDRRHVNRGRVCTTWKKPELVNILWNLKIPSIPDIPLTGLSQDELLQYLRKENVTIPNEQLQTFPLDKIKFFYKWYKTGKTKEALCGIIQQYFREHGRILEA